MSDVAKFVDWARDQGMRAALKRTGHALTWRLHTWLDRNYDREHEVDTSSHAFSWNLRMRSEGDDIGTEEPMYLPTSSLAFRSVMANLPSDLRRFTFVDYGSGKGKTLLLAAHYPFQRIIGVEFAEELHTIATGNVATYRRRHAHVSSVECVLADATTWQVPAGPCVFYLFNPFELTVMEKVTRLIAASYADNPRPMYIVYYKPKYPQVLERETILTDLPCRNRSAWGVPNPYPLRIYATREALSMIPC